MAELHKDVQELRIALGDLRQFVGRMDGKQDEILAGLARSRQDMIDHEGRDVERFGIIGSRMGLLEKTVADSISRFKGAKWLFGVILGIIAALGVIVEWFRDWRH